MVTLSSFSIEQYETTCELWYEVKQWADCHGYSFANAGREGHDEPGTPGGCWDIDETVCTVACRVNYIPYGRSNIIGFRVVCR
jgi:formylglycine-generating enzyme required for sulfatase activity